jgi:hypothetical protein
MQDISCINHFNKRNALHMYTEGNVLRIS